MPKTKPKGMGVSMRKKGVIDEIIFSRNDEDSRKTGLCFDCLGECAVMMRFMDGEAVEVEEEGEGWKDITAEDDPIILTYPKRRELTREMRREIRKYTSRDDITPFDVALKYGKPKRLSGKIYG